MFYNARWYDPNIGRFAQADTVIPTETQGTQAWDRYAYVNNNPIINQDPSGHWLESALDIGFLLYDIGDIAVNGLNWENGLSLVADAAGLALPVATGGGLAVRALMHADDAIKVVNTTDGIADTATTLDKIINTANTTENLADGLNTVENAETAVSFGPNLFGSDTKTRAGFDVIKPKLGFVDVGIHGSPDSFFVRHNDEWVSLDHRTLATYIKKNGWNGEPIRLISCSTGCLPGGIAKNLANKLGTIVMAPDDTLWSLLNGELTIGPKSWSRTGNWRIFVPGGKPK
jgi:hypothetical protein